jgi:leader peptidase (prepilin peptidase)/N-methyltransferase
MGLTAVYLSLMFPPFDALARFVFCATLCVCALIDYDWRVIPNAITFAGIPLGILAAWLLVPEVGLGSSLAGFAIGGGFLYLTGKIYAMIRHAEGVGLGDVWLVGMVGAFLGWAGVFFTLLGGAILATLGSALLASARSSHRAFRDRSPQPEGRSYGEKPANGDASWLGITIPFGPFLASAAVLFALFQPRIVHLLLPQ